MANDKTLIPPVIWAERNEKFYVTINLEDCKNVSVEFDENKCTFSATGGHDQNKYAVTLEFFKEISPKECTYAILPRHIPMVVAKKEGGSYWNQLLKIKKAHWLKTDFDKWRDEDDSDFDEAEDTNFENMMKKMGNFSTDDNGPADMEEEEDSDDEELPDLQ